MPKSVIAAIVFSVIFFLCGVCRAPITSGGLKYLGGSLLDAPVFMHEDGPPAAPAAEMELEEVLGTEQAKALALEDQLDDIAEQLDIIQQQVNELIAEQEVEEDDKDKDEEDKEKEDEKEKENNKKTYPAILIYEVKVNPIAERFVRLYNPNGQDVDLTGWYMQRKTATSDTWNSFVSSTYFEGKTIQANGYFIISRELAGSDILLNITLSDGNSLALKNPNKEVVSEISCQETQAVSTTGAGSSEPTYLKILISEIKPSPIDGRFVELYNPNSQDVDLTGWYMQRKTSDDYSSFVTKTDFEGKTIAGKSYFLISRSDEAADILKDNLTITENNSFALKNPKQDVSDEFALAGLPVPLKEQSLGRKWDEELGEYKNIGDNSKGFEIQIPTPKAQNITWVEPESPVLESIEITISPSKTVYFTGEELDISGLEVTGFYSDSSFNIETVELENISGFDSSVAVTGQVLTITISGKTTVYAIDILEPLIAKNILINEIQIEGETTKDDWVELYNPNDFEFNISQWSIQRSPSTGTIYRKNFGADDKIIALGYFLIVRNDASQALLDIADMSCSALQLSSGSSVYLVKNQEDIEGGDDEDIIDKVGIGENAFSFETVSAPVPPARQSIARNSGVDTNDNSADFVVSEAPSPGS